MTLLTFNYCGLDAVNDMGLIVNFISAPVVPEVTENTQEVPGMIGKLYLGNSYGQKIYEIEVTIPADNSTQFNDKLHELTDIFMNADDLEYPMQFSNDPGYTYYGHFTTISKPEVIVRNSAWRRVVLTFSCSDPKGYGAYINNDIITNPANILPLGRSECYPIFTCIPKKDVTKIAVSDEDGNYVYLGADIDPEEGDVQNLEPRVFSDVTNDLTLWTPVTKPTFTVDSAVILGSYKNTTDALEPSSFGANTAGKYHGPLIQRMLPGSYGDYRIRARMLHYQYYARARAKIELYLLDSNGYRIGKIELSDSYTSKEINVKVQLGNQTTYRNLYNSMGTVKAGKEKTRTIKVKNGTKKVKVKGKDKKTTTKTVQLWKNVKLTEDLDTNTFTHFYGYIELQKIGNKYRVEILKLTNGSNPGWKKPIVVTWTDTKNTYTNRSLAGVALYAGKYDIYEDTANPRVSYTVNKLQLTDLTVNHIINGGNNPTKPAVIARKGDEIKINCEDHQIYKNGRYFMNRLHIGSEFITMEGGVDKTFAFEPDLKDADWYVEYTPTTS